MITRRSPVGARMILTVQQLGEVGATSRLNGGLCYETSIFISFLDYWQVTLIWSPYGDASLIHSLLIGDTSTTYYTDVAIRVTMTLY